MKVHLFSLVLAFSVVVSTLSAAPPFDLKGETYSGPISDSLVNVDSPQFTFEGIILNPPKNATSKFVVDLNNQDSFFGLQTLDGKNFADWGLADCKADDGCNIQGGEKTDFSYWPELYPNLKNLKYVDANVVLRLDKDVTFDKDSPPLPIKLLGTSKANSPFS